MVSADDRIERLLVRAAACDEAAMHTRNPDIQRVYLELAQQWRDLASQVRMLLRHSK